MQSNAHDVDEKSDAAARRGSSVVLDLEGAMARVLMAGDGRGDGYVIRAETGGFCVNDNQKKDQGGSRVRPGSIV